MGLWVWGGLAIVSGSALVIAVLFTVALIHQGFWTNAALILLCDVTLFGIFRLAIFFLSAHIEI